MISELLSKIPGRKVVVILGLQWGDEGKGKVSDLVTKHFSKDEYVVVGANGGGNAGHNVVVEKSALTGEKLKLAFHELPGGVARSEHVFLAQGRVINLENLIKEITEIESHQPSSSRKVYVSSRAIVNVSGIFDKIETIIEEAKGEKKVGTTRQGIGPAYAGEALRTAITMGQLFTRSETDLESLVEQQYETFPYLIKEEILPKLLETKRKALELIRQGKIEVVADDFLTSEFARDKHVVVEGAQAVGLGKFGGSYPHNTSSDCSVHGLLSSALLPGAGLVVGVTKAIVSKVGGGRFASKLEDHGVPVEFVDEYRQTAGEFGATTGRPRQVGFFDAVQMKHSFKTGNRPDVLWINMGDMLKLFAERGVANKVVVGYRVSRFSPSEGKRVLISLTDSIPLPEDEIEEVLLEDLPSVKDLEKDLSVWLAEIRKRIEFTGPVVVGVGPGSEENVFFEN